MVALTVCPASDFWMKLVHPHQLVILAPLHNHHRWPNPVCSVKLSSARINKHYIIKMQSSLGRESLRDGVKVLREFPFKKAEERALQRLGFLGQSALKWCFLTLFISSSLSDIALSISRDKELLIPLGLFAGCATSMLINEASRDLVPNLEEERNLRRWVLVGMGCFFVMAKLIAAYLLKGQPLLILHFGNGGLIHVLWLWKVLVAQP